MSFFIREDPLTGKKIIISSLRSRRPQLIKGLSKEEPIQCPFCPGNESLTAEPVDICEEEGKWIVRVVPNKFPAIQGLHDVIIEAREHSADIDTIDHLEKVLEVYQRRMKYFYNIKGIKYVAVFRNRGKEAGASIQHPHSQVIGLPFYPERYLLERKKYETSEKHPMKNLIEKEKEEGVRLIKETDNFVAILAYAPTTPYETWIIPKTVTCCFLEEKRLDELSYILKYGVKLLKVVLGENMPYNLTLQSGSPWDKDYHYYFRIMPRISVFGGFEMETNNIIVGILPEDASKELKLAKSKVDIL